MNFPTPITDQRAIHVKHSDDDVWINPIGGLGDIVMLSSVLKLVHDKDPEKKFRLIRRARYVGFLKDHPAIEYVGFPPEGTKNIIETDYWREWPMGPGKDRAFQRLAERFGLVTPVKEKLYLPFEAGRDEFLERVVPWGEKNILIAPYSDSPRKIMPLELWENLVYLLTEDNYFVLQSGKKEELNVRGAYSIIGATDPKQLLATINKCDLVITSDNYVMHAAKLLNKPAIVLWGPTQREVYGYEGHTHVEAPLEHCDQYDKCLGPHVPENYATHCPLEGEHCMGKISPEKIFDLVTAKI